MNTPEYPLGDYFEHVMRLQNEADQSHKMADYATSLNRPRAAKIANMVGFYRSEAANRSLARGWSALPSTDQIPGELKAMNIPQPIGESLIFAVNMLHKASGYESDIDITSPSFQRLPVLRHDGTVIGTETGNPTDGRIGELVTDVFALTGVDFRYPYDMGIVHQDEHRSPLGPEMLFYKHLDKVRIVAMPPRRSQAAEVFAPPSDFTS